MLTFNYRQLHVLDYPIFKLTFILYDKKRTTASKKHSSRSIHALLSIPFSQEDNSKDIKQVVSTWKKG